MRVLGWLLLVGLGGACSSAVAQSPAVDAALREQLATLKYVKSLYDPGSGAFRVQAGGPPSLRAINGAVRVYKMLKADQHGLTFPHADAAKFVRKCLDPQTGGFAEPNGQPDITISSIGLMAALELGVSKEELKPAMIYLAKHAKTFEEVRIAAAAVEAWGVPDCPFDLRPWHTIADELIRQKPLDPRDGGARQLGSYVAFKLRLGQKLDQLSDLVKTMQAGQRADGGWGKAGEKSSDLETTYRVMRALHLAQSQPSDPAKLRAFVAQCRNADHGYGVSPGQPSSLSGVYYASYVQNWLK